MEKKEADSISELSKLKEERSNNIGDIESLREEFAAVSQNHTAAQTELESAKAEVERLKRSLAQTEQSSTTSSSELSTLKAEHDQVKKDLEAVQSQLTKEVKKAEQASTQKAALQEDNKGLLEQLEEIRGRVGGLAEEREQMGQTLEAERKKVVDLQVSRQMYLFPDVDLIPGSDRAVFERWRIRRATLRLNTTSW